jgi:hypothetical protein
VPAHQSGRRDEEDTPVVMTEKTGQSGQHGAIDGGVPGPCHVAA